MRRSSRCDGGAINCKCDEFVQADDEDCVCMNCGHDKNEHRVVCVGKTSERPAKTGPELAAEFGFEPLALSGAARTTPAEALKSRVSMCVARVWDNGDCCACGEPLAGRTDFCEWHRQYEIEQSDEKIRHLLGEIALHRARIKALKR